jgi:hypothetical protein
MKNDTYKRKGIDKTNSSYQKDVNRLRKRCHEFQESIQMKEQYQWQAFAFIRDMLSQGKITKDDLRPYFKRKSQVKKDLLKSM